MAYQSFDTSLGIFFPYDEDAPLGICNLSSFIGSQGPQSENQHVV